MGVSIINQPGEQVRKYYRSQGAKKAIETAIENLQKDAVISMTVDVKLLERIVKIIEGSDDA